MTQQEQLMEMLKSAGEPFGLIEGNKIAIYNTVFVFNINGSLKDIYAERDDDVY